MHGCILGSESISKLDVCRTWLFFLTLATSPSPIVGTFGDLNLADHAHALSFPRLRRHKAANRIFCIGAIRCRSNSLSGTVAARKVTVRPRLGNNSRGATPRLGALWAAPFGTHLLSTRAGWDRRRARHLSIRRKIWGKTRSLGGQRGLSRQLGSRTSSRAGMQAAASPI